MTRLAQSKATLLTLGAFLTLAGYFVLFHTDQVKAAIGIG